MHLLKNLTIGRREVLRGLVAGSAVSVALPPLEAMLHRSGEALASGEELPRRFMTWLWGNGCFLDRFEPDDVGEDWTLSEPFEPVQDYLTVCTGLMNRCEELIAPHEGMTAFNGYTFTLRPDLPGFASDYSGPTIDQLIADAIASRVQTAVRSLQVMVSKFDSPADNGTTGEVLSVRGVPGALTALPPQTNPVAIWQTLFGEFVPSLDDREQRLSILDYVREDADRLREQLGKVDNLRLDAHFEAIAELEAKITALPPVCELPDAPTETNEAPNGEEVLMDINAVMSDLIAMAFRCDVTRVASMIFLGLSSEAVLGEIDATTTHHLNSHGLTEEYHDGIVLCMQGLSNLMQTLAATEDFDGTNLLDSTMIYATSDCALGWNHSIRRQPILIGGHGRDYLRHPGIHYQAVAAPDPRADDAPSEGNTSDVLLACLQAFDPEATEIGEGEPYSNTPLSEILA